MIENAEMARVAGDLKKIIKLQSITKYKNPMEEQILLISAYQIVLLKRKQSTTIKRYSFIFQRCFSETPSHTVKQEIKEILCIIDCMKQRWLLRSIICR